MFNPPLPGGILREEVIKPLGVSVTEAARRLGVSRVALSRLLEVGWVWSSKRNKAVYGVSVVLLVWTDGQIRIPIGFRVEQMSRYR